MTVNRYEFDQWDEIRVGNHSRTPLEQQQGRTLEEVDAERAPFKNILGEITDPADATIRVRPPSGDVVVYRYPVNTGTELPLLHDTLGRVFVNLLLEQDGIYVVTLRGVQGIKAAQTIEIYARGTV